MNKSIACGDDFMILLYFVLIQITTMLGLKNVIALNSVYHHKVYYSTITFNRLQCFIVKICKINMLANFFLYI